MNIYQNAAESIGKTPLIKLNRLPGLAKASVLAKIEGRNPTFSVKCRIGAALIADAEERGVLKPGMTIVEPTSGNTGIGLAYAAAIKGYSLVLFMPASMSLERRKVLLALGAKLELTPAPEGMTGAVNYATELVTQHPDQYFMPQQFNNPANPAIHEKTTGPEIWNDTDGQVDVVVAGVGTGGTISGIGHYFKNIQKKHVHMVAVEPQESPVISQKRNGEELKPGPHKIQGIGAGFIPQNLDLDILDEVVQVSSDDAVAMARRLGKEEGLLVGISSGAATVAALQIAHRPEYAGKNIVVILPDAGERYLSTVLFENIQA